MACERKTMRSGHLTAGLVVGALIFWPGAAEACRCKGPFDAAKLASLGFVGRIESVRSAQRPPAVRLPSGATVHPEAKLLVTYAVEETWKGTLGSTITLEFTADNSCSVGKAGKATALLKEGNRMAVLASGQPLHLCNSRLIPEKELSRFKNPFAPSSKSAKSQ